MQATVTVIENRAESMNMKRFEGINHAFRPESYWAVFDPLQAILVTSKELAGGK